MQPSYRPVYASIGALALAVAACGGNISDPHKVNRVQSPLVGQWILRTQIDTYSFETGLDTAVCGSAPYCTHYRSPVSSTYLSGMLQVQDTFGLKGVVVPTVQVTGELTFCDSLTFNAASGCAGAGKAYVGNLAGAADSTKKGSLSLNIFVPNPDTTTALQLSTVLASGTYAGDSIYGRFRWLQYVTRSPPSYYGSFVMRRVK